MVIEWIAALPDAALPHSMDGWFLVLWAFEGITNQPAVARRLHGAWVADEYGVPFGARVTHYVAIDLPLGNEAIGIEIEEKYCEIAAERLRQRSLFEVEAVG